MGLLYFLGTYGMGILGLIALGSDNIQPMTAYLMIISSIVVFWVNLFDSIIRARKKVALEGSFNAIVDRGVKSVFLNLVFPGVGFFLIKKKRIGLLALAAWVGYLFLGDGPEHVIPLVIYVAIVLGTVYASFQNNFMPFGVVLIIAILALTRTYITSIDYVLRDIRISRVSGNSNCPTLCDGDVVLEKSISPSSRKSIRKGALISFVFDDRQLSRLEIYTKRVYALAGDTVCITDGKVLVNGVTIEFDAEEQISESFVGGSQNPYVVPPHSLFVIGDNIRDSFDSRHFGAIPVDNVTSQPTKILWPISRAGPI